MKIEFDLTDSLPDDAFRLAGIGKDAISFMVKPEISPALAVWEKWELLKPTTNAKLTVQGPAGFCSSFHYQIAVYIADALIILQEKTLTNQMIAGEEEPLVKHLRAIRAAHSPDSDVFAHSLAELASYAQAEWTGAFIPCPIERRIRSIFTSLLRICEDEDLLYGKGLDPPVGGAHFAEPGKSDKGALGKISTLFQCSLCSASVRISENKMIEALNANLGCSVPKYPSSPRLEGIFDNFEFSGHYWLKSLVERLKVDRDAYKRDVARARKEYSVLVGVGKDIVPVETVRIEAPESLLFDLWAWRDTESSKEQRGFPLAWIDNGWLRKGFELRLDPSSKSSLKSLTDQTTALALPAAEHVGDAGWSLTFSDRALKPDAMYPLKSDVSFRLKRKLFPETATLNAEIISITEIDLDRSAKVIRIPWKKPTPLLEQAIRESDPANAERIIPDDPRLHDENRKAYLWAEVEFADINIYRTWAGDEVATILYSLLRPASNMTLPNDFLKQHIHRHIGLVCVWTREGIVIAHQGDEQSKAAVRKLKDEIRKAARLEGELECLIEERKKRATLDETSGGKSESEESTRDRVNRLVTNQLDLRQSSAEPDLRALRGFLDRRHAQEIYDAFRQSEADANQLRTLETMNEASSRLDWLEAVLFAFAITEAGHILGEALLPSSWVFWTVIASILGFFGSSVFLLFSKIKWFQDRHAEGIGKLVLVLVFGFIYIYALLLSRNNWGGVKDARTSQCSSPASSRLLAAPSSDAGPSASTSAPAPLKTSVSKSANIPKSVKANPTAVVPPEPAKR